MHHSDPEHKFCVWSTARCVCLCAAASRAHFTCSRHSGTTIRMLKHIHTDSDMHTLGLASAAMREEHAQSHIGRPATYGPVLCVLSRSLCCRDKIKRMSQRTTHLLRSHPYSRRRRRQHSTTSHHCIREYGVSLYTMPHMCMFKYTYRWNNKRLHCTANICYSHTMLPCAYE